MSQPWMEDAECAKPGVNPEWFFSECAQSDEYQIAESICHRCKVKTQCLEYALDSPMQVFGRWGAQGQSDINEQRRKRPKPDVFHHGTAAGARRHYRRGERPCEPCRKAAALYNAMLTERKLREGGCAS